MNVSDKLVEILTEEGISDVFGIPGEQIMPLYKALSTSDINHILTRHEQAAAHAAEIIDDNSHWLNNEKQVGPVTFLQQHIEGLLKQYPNLQLEKTEKSGNYKLTLKDMWRLEDAGVKDPFVECYTRYKHADKYLSTYLNRSFIREDGKIHARFTNLLKTTRTSCTSPNLQNLPSRDKQFPLKNMFVPPEGAILCATDFSFKLRAPSSNGKDAYSVELLEA
jgi:DNA polymerase I-like protein with 3'-5' exonuclease and polymerase domains